MILEVNDALKSIGIEDDHARTAAGALSDNATAIADLSQEMNERFNRLEVDLADKFGRLRTEQVAVRAVFAILMAAVASIVLKLYF